MAFTLPDKGEGANDVQSILFQEDLEVLVAGINGIDAVLSGCACTAQGSPDMTVAVAKGAVLSNGTLFAVAAANATIGAADATNPRLDLVVINSSGSIATRAGTAAVNPKPPARSANDVVLAQIYVPATDTTIGSNQIVDRRVLLQAGPVLVKKVTSPVTINTDNTKRTYLTVTLPNGLLLSGKILRVRCGGTYLSNNGTPTWTLTLNYGGTDMFADATAATAADTDRGSWDLDVLLVATGNATQVLCGRVCFQTVAGKTAPTSGTAGDLAVTSQVVTAIRGSASVDSDAANRDFVVQWTMSGSNGSVETVMDYANAEIL